MNVVRKKHKKLKIVLGVVMGIVILLLLIVYFFIRHYYSKMNYVADKDVKMTTDAGEESGLSDNEEKELQEEVEKIAPDVKLPDNKSVYNVLLVGVDRRDSSWSGNSDSMILLSINEEKKQILMMSFMRDLYADIPGIGVRKLNAAHANGGGPLLVQTIEENYKVNIDGYASVDFSAMIKIVDIIGGVDITVSDAEADVANDYITEMCKLNGVDASSHLLRSGGDLHLDGYQAVGYARIRYVGNSDYQRTERQRAVLTQIIGKSKDMNLSQIQEAANAVLPNVTHNIKQSTVLSLITKAPALSNYKIQTSRVPYDSMFTTKKEILVPDFAQTLPKIHEEIYGEDSELVEE